MTLKNRGLGWLLAGSLLGLAPVAGAADAGGAPAHTVNLNTASAGELEALPGIGEARAKAIVAVREKRGGFKSVDELSEVKGLGKAALDKLRPLVTTGSRASGPPR
jgi:competence protein ComEA